MTGPKAPADLTPDADHVGDWAAPSKSVHSNASCRDSNRVVDLQQIYLTADKENAQAPGRKGPVRKALFGGQGDVFNGSQALASLWPSEPASQHVDGKADGLNKVEHYTNTGSAEAQQAAEYAPPSSDTVDFASVFDFL